MRGDQHIEGYENYIFKSKSRFIVKRYWRETCSDYKRI
jgi:hypothetical protein